jgi:mono/diheme cytochrome c family protein
MNWRLRFSATFLGFAWLAFSAPGLVRAQQSTGHGQTGDSTQQQLIQEGENKFHANCGRCHQSPHHLAPRVVMTVERHMRVRATLTDEDVKAIVAYLTQ